MPFILTGLPKFATFLVAVPDYTFKTTALHLADPVLFLQGCIS